MHRRQFLKQSCALCLLGGVGGAALVESCGPAGKLVTYKTAVVNKQAAVPLAQMPPAGVLLIRAKGLDYNLALHHRGDGYEALLLECTHFSNPLSVAGNGYQCNVHGSRFDAEGKVTNGPADRPLRRYPATVQGDQIIIQIA